MTIGIGQIKDFFLSAKGRRVLVIGGIILMLIIMAGSFIPAGGESAALPQENAAEIERQLEERLENLLSQIDGAGKVTVMITLETTSERVYAEDIRTERSDGAKSGTQSEVVLAGSGKTPVEKNVIQPVVRGAAVVCAGASDPVVREKLANAAASVLNIGLSRVYVTC